MELLLILTYTAICVVIFKIFKIPLNKWTVPTAGLGGVVMIGALVLFMSYNHPFTSDARIYFVSTPVLPSVRGPVIEVPVTANEALKKVMSCFASTRDPTSTRWIRSARPWPRRNRPCSG